ncbi:hypothetical protein P3G55_12995 [Leptospira sp. 96542]|nr:hypothetical protein [Leptospira sp. 96542]
MKSDVRWKQRFDNFLKAYTDFFEAIQLTKARELSKLERQGLVTSTDFGLSQETIQNIQSVFF